MTTIIIIGYGLAIGKPEHLLFPWTVIAKMLLAFIPFVTSSTATLRLMNK
jgi:hypothetical protein